MLRVTQRQLWVDALGAGAAAGLVAEALVLRMNPEIPQAVSGVLIGMPLWASWGMLMVGVPLLAVLAIVQRFRFREDRWAAPELFAVVFFLAAALAVVNARLHVHLLLGSAHRVLVQDAVGWAVAAVLAVGIGIAVRRFGGGPWFRVAFSIFMIFLPILRVGLIPTPSRQFLEVAPNPLGTPTRPLLVIGLEGFDLKFLVADTVSSAVPSLERLREDGALVSIRPHRPYLRWALWTSVATGTYPGQHGVKAHWGWNLPLVFNETLRLLPWTPQGSRMILPWGLAERVSPPPVTVAPLWARLRASGVETQVFGWPGSWGEDPSLRVGPEIDRSAVLEPVMSASLHAALEPFPERRAQIWEAVVRDQARVDAARAAMAVNTGDVWIHLETLFLARQYHEPLRRRHTHERQFIELVTELVDDQLGTLLAAVPEGTLVAIVSPYGLAPPGSFERLKRLIGGGEEWHTSAESCPDGLMVLLGNGVSADQRVSEASPPDLAPTLCYLLGLPVAQYMEGSVIVGAVEPSFLSEFPLRVVD